MDWKSRQVTLLNTTAILCLAVGCLSLSCSKEIDTQPTFVQVPFAGTWIVSEARENGVLQNEWLGLELTFEQLKKDSGAYYLPATPGDSVWAKSGGWQVIDSIRLVRDNYANLYIFFNREGKLLTTFTIESADTTGTCPEYPCPLDVTGTWVFAFNPLPKN
ncbi:hypothetical protein RT717_18390 [Imperialibacter roseus]|uniref:Lipocalin-like domain-containing protein n=1 Tax=Imperialibacter roseus TaxID=1324217 RepID=A0ABZ0ILI3_9BACT|nr:hypothetical protein [Imperialibacter roseus]WOK05054.1 hypothetical protein RT717_18390 [Imperialibacter roseus]